MGYPGSKNGSGVFQAIINQMPPHRVYIESLLGSGAVLANKRPAAASIVIDLDAALLDVWRNDARVTTVICDDAISFLRSYSWVGDELVYCDPPYLMYTRSCQCPLYVFEMTEAQHVELLDVLVHLPCMVMVSGYYSELYVAMLHEWRTVTFSAMTRAGKVATEWLWMNFPEPLELHDYRFLGSTWRERDRMKQRRKRWKARLLAMSVLERHAMMLAIHELRKDLASSDVMMGAAELVINSDVGH